MPGEMVIIKMNIFFEDDATAKNKSDVSDFFGEVGVELDPHVYGLVASQFIDVDDDFDYGEFKSTFETMKDDKKKYKIKEILYYIWYIDLYLPDESRRA